MSATSHFAPDQQLVPALYVRDLKVSSEYYQKVGFHFVRQDGIFMELLWENSPLFLVETAEHAPPFTIGNLRVLVADVDAHWHRIQRLDLEVVSPIEDRPYGLREFTIAGPDGLNIRFAGYLDREKS